MIEIKRIEEKDHDELFRMYYDYYQSALGKSWTDKIPVAKIRDFLDFNKRYAEDAAKKAFQETPPVGMIDKRVLGLYSDENLLGFTCIGIFEDNTGGVYHIYVKPEYHQKFIEGFTHNNQAVRHLMIGIEEYFSTQNIGSVELEVPHTLKSLKKVVEKEGYVPRFDYYDATKYTKER